jgi:Cu(I)/Ag(I) efflux system membrane fusion protein
MFVSAVVHSVLAADGGAAPTGVEGKFSCPMHPQVLRDEAGPCPICEMNLLEIPVPAPAHDHAAHGPETAAASEYSCPMECEGAKTYPAPGNCPVCEMKLEAVLPSPVSGGGGSLAVPASAVLDSGTRQLAYVERSRGLFEPRELVLGPRAGEFFPVLSGLTEGERVVTRGGFLIDSQFQITGHPSLFYPGGLMAGGADHQHGDPAPQEPSTSAQPDAPVQHNH